MTLPQVPVPDTPNRPDMGAAALRLVLAYAAFAGLWIVLSDQMVGWLFSDAALVLEASMLKGWAFVIVTSVLLYVLLRRLLGQVMRLTQGEYDALAGKTRTEALLGALAESSPDVIFVKDLQGRYLLFNHEGSRVLGRTQAQVLGQDDAALFPADLAAVIRERDQRVIACDAITTAELRLPTVQGERDFLVTRGPLRDGEGQVVGVFGIARDVTQRLQIEADLRQHNEELERFNRAMVGREIDMIHLKAQVNALSRQLGQVPPSPEPAHDAVDDGRMALHSTPSPDRPPA
jgi:PAS domain S-box-containing protein